MGMMALPLSAMTRNEDPKLVYLPNPLIANGHIPAYNRALGSPIMTRYQRDISVVIPKKFTVPDVVMINTDNTRLILAQINNASRCLRYFGIRPMPRKYPAKVRSMVYEGIFWAGPARLSPIVPAY